MAFDRSKFQATKVNNLTAQDKEFEKKTEFKKSGRVSFVNLAEGKNKVRVYPAHPGTKSFMQPCTTHFLEVLNEYTNKDGEKISELKRKPVFSGKSHSKLGKCPIDMYIMHVYKMANEEYQDKAEKEKFVAPLKGQNGITANTKWVAYVDCGGSFGRMNLPTSVKNSMNDIAIGQDSEDGVIATDPFTDPDNGRCIYVTYDKQLSIPQAKREASKYYSTAIDLNSSTPLSDEQLNLLLEQKSLEELYVNVYTKRDFDLAMEGLERFDKKNNYGIMQMDSFLDAVEAIYNELPDAPSKDDDKKEDVKPASMKEKAVEKSKEAVEEKETDLPFDKGYEEMTREELEGVVRRNKLPIKLSSRLSDEDLVEWIIEEMKIVEAESSAKEVEEQEEEEVTPRSRRGSASRLSAVNDELKA
jgi:hypothetical protein